MPSLHVLTEAHYVSDSDETISNCFNFLLNSSKADRLRLKYLGSPLEGSRVVSLPHWQDVVKRNRKKKGKMEVKEEQNSKQEKMNKHAIKDDRESKRQRECDE